MIRMVESAINTEDGTIEKNIYSNSRVKSKSSRHPRMNGPNELSSQDVLSRILSMFDMKVFCNTFLDRTTLLFLQ